ncbi:hypothetical protein NL676_036876 [Syzygium grande]|nr:hypothetical protein NL676_036876 [Syzygium grande]
MASGIFVEAIIWARQEGRWLLPERGQGGAPREIRGGGGGQEDRDRDSEEEAEVFDEEALLVPAMTPPFKIAYEAMPVMSIFDS